MNVPQGVESKFRLYMTAEACSEALPPVYNLGAFTFETSALKSALGMQAQSRKEALAFELQTTSTRRLEVTTSPDKLKQSCTSWQQSVDCCI